MGNLHLEILDNNRRLIFQKLSFFAHLGYLAGGTALALWFGHRESIDFDFFSPVVFDPVKLSQKLSSVGSFTVEFAKGISLIGEFKITPMTRESCTVPA